MIERVLKTNLHVGQATIIDLVAMHSVRCGLLL